MSSETKGIFYFVAVMISIITTILVLINRLEIDNSQYAEVLELKQQIDAKPDEKGYDSYRQWMKTSTEDNYISVSELKSLDNLREDIRKENLIHGLRK